MKTNLSTFLLGALVGAALALAARAAILEMDDGNGHDHGAVEMPEKAPEKAPEEPDEEYLVDLGNESCPIMGRPVDGKTYSVWNGLRVGHCCPPCSEKFLADPEKALRDAGIEWREAAERAAALRGSGEGKR